MTEIAGDAGSDGTVDYLQVMTFTDPVLFVGTETLDVDNDGTVDFLEEFVFDAEDHLLYLAYESPVDGVWELEWTQTWDPQTVLLTVEQITPETTYQMTYTYDAQLRVVGELSRYEDTVQGFVFDEEDTLVFDGVCP